MLVNPCSARVSVRFSSDFISFDLYSTGTSYFGREDGNAYAAKRRDVLSAGDTITWKGASMLPDGEDLTLSYSATEDNSSISILFTIKYWPTTEGGLLS